MTEPFQNYRGEPTKSAESLLLWLDSSRSPFLNMGIDESCFLECKNFEGPLLRIYDWDRPSISIGYFQRYSEVRTKDFSIVRRPTGGGVVVHDRDLTYSLIIPSRHWFYGVKRAESYGLIGKIIITALREVGVQAVFAENYSRKLQFSSNTLCFETPVRYDVVDGTNNKKLAGAAQKRSQEGLLHQGSILLQDLSFLNRRKIIESLAAQFKLYFKSKLKLFKPSSQLLNQADLLTTKKYSESTWNRKK